MQEGGAGKNIYAHDASTGGGLAHDAQVDPNENRPEVCKSPVLIMLPNLDSPATTLRFA